jgi:hypothetical protein
MKKSEYNLCRVDYSHQNVDHKIMDFMAVQKRSLFILRGARELSWILA